MLLVGILSFVFGAVVATAGWTLYGFVLAAREKLKAAEDAKKLYEEQLAKQQEQAAQVGKLLAEAIKRRQALQQNAVAPTDTNVSASVKERLKKAMELSSKQNKIDVRKGAEFQLQYNELELQKLAVLKSILADGFDPNITIKYNTGEQDMLLSKYVESLQKALT